MSPAMNYRQATGLRARGDLSPNPRSELAMTDDPPCCLHCTHWRGSERAVLDQSPARCVRRRRWTHADDACARFHDATRATA
jgi:hypothetical protein